MDETNWLTNKTLKRTDSSSVTAGKVSFGEMKEEKRQSTGNLSGSRQKCKVYDIQSFFGDSLQKEIIGCFPQKDKKS